MKKIVLMLAAVLAVSSVSAFANKPEATKGKKPAPAVDCKADPKNEHCDKEHHEKH